MDEATCDESIVTLSTDELRVDVRAGRGARITSLVNRRDGREWLAQSRRAFDTRPILSTRSSLPTMRATIP